MLSHHSLKFWLCSNHPLFHPWASKWLHAVSCELATRFAREKGAKGSRWPPKGWIVVSQWRQHMLTACPHDMPSCPHFPRRAIPRRIFMFLLETVLCYMLYVICYMPCLTQWDNIICHDFCNTNSEKSCHDFFSFAVIKHNNQRNLSNERFNLVYILRGL